MAFFNCYCDTGGSESAADGTVIATAGVVATADKWNKFDDGWTAALNEFGVTELHMRLFAHSRGQYEGWKGDEPRRKAFLARLTKEAARHGINKVFVTAVVLPDYRAADSKYRLTEAVGGPYSLAQTGCLYRTVDWLFKHKEPQDTIAFFVEKGDAGQGAFLNLMKREKSIEPTVLPRVDVNTGRSYTPFEAADLISYEYRYEYDKIIKTRRRPARSRGALKELRRMLPLDVGICDTRMIERFCDTLKIPVRAPSTNSP